MKAKRPSLRKQLGIVAAVAFAGAAVAGLIVAWEAVFSPPPERLVKIYRVHGCTCAFTFADALRGAGYSVQVVELKNLSGPRGTLHSPPDLTGCHVGVYLNYFLEGHVSPAVLAELAATRPDADGVATQASALAETDVSIERDEHSLVFLVEEGGGRQAWFQPP